MTTIFVTGATGVLGRPVVSGLIERGHAVHALSRSPENYKALSAMGAIPRAVDLFNTPALAERLADCDTVLHLATHIPATSQLKKPGIWNENDRLRREGTRSIVAAAEMAGSIRTVLYPGISLFYGNGGATWLDASNARTEPASVHGSTLDAENCIRGFGESGKDRRGIVLRFGTFYGPTSPDSLVVIDTARRGWFTPLADRGTYSSLIWIDDAASAVIAAFEAGLSGVFDVVEDMPATQNEAAQALAEAVGRTRLRPLPRFLLRLALPPDLREILRRSQRISNRRFRDATGWRPSVPSQQDGWRYMVRNAPAPALDRAA